MKTAKSLLFAITAFVGIAVAADAALIFSDSFSDPDGTLLNGRIPDVGSAWNVTTGVAQLGIKDNAVDTSLVSDSTAVAFGGFTSAVTTEQTLTLTFSTEEPASTAFLGTGGWAGINLFVGGSNGTTWFFLGKPYGSTNLTWGVTGQAVGWNPRLLSGALTDAQTAVFTYAYSTGAWVFSVGGSSITGTTRAGLALDTLAISSGRGESATAIKVSEIAVRVDTAASATADPSVVVVPVSGKATVGWNNSIASLADVEFSPDLSVWTKVSTNNTDGTFQHANGNTSRGFYRLNWNPKSTMIAVQGGTLPTSSFYSGMVVPTLLVGKYEVTWDEWREVRDWALNRGYTDLAGVGYGSAGNHPVSYVNWYDALKWCNAKSEKEGLSPVYQLGNQLQGTGVVYRIGEERFFYIDHSANGYRLPTRAEWEWAALGGIRSRGFVYSGSNDVDAVAWHADNSNHPAVVLDGAGRGTWPVGTKGANEVGLHDMSGNVFEWLLDFSTLRGIAGGSFNSEANLAAIAYRSGTLLYNNRTPGIGLRVFRTLNP